MAAVGGIVKRCGAALALSATLAGAAVSVHAQAPAFAAPGTSLQLAVELRYESQGRRQNKVDLFEWTGLRTATFTVPLVARQPSPLSAYKGPESGQLAKAQRAGAQAQQAAQAMAPMMAAAEQIMARCGDDEACITRETQKLGARMHGDAALSGGGQAVGAALRDTAPEAPRYQLWDAGSGQAQGRYEVDEFLHAVHSDPICMSLPKQRCTRDERRNGQGPLGWGNKPGYGAAGVAQAEWDSRSRQLTLSLPGLGPLPAQDSVKTDEPPGTHSSPGLVWLKSPELGAEAVRQALTVTLAAPGALKGLSGEKQVAVPGADGAGGKLVLRWRIEGR